jgi:hypothetical protein
MNARASLRQQGGLEALLNEPCHELIKWVKGFKWTVIGHLKSILDWYIEKLGR